MKKYAVITGDIIDFTSLGNKRREELIGDTDDNIKRWVKQPEDAAIFRGDSFQLLFEDLNLAVIRSIQLICWFKKQAEPKFPHLSTRISLGIGGLAFKGKTVLDSDGEAFHLSGRNFDLLETDELLRITTGKAEQDEPLAIFIDVHELDNERLELTTSGSRILGTGRPKRDPGKDRKTFKYVPVQYREKIKSGALEGNGKRYQIYNRAITKSLIMEMNILLRLLMAHLLGDFILQPNSWVSSKNTKKIRSGALYLHAGVITALTYLFLWDANKWYLPLIIGSTHLLIDIWKSYQKNTLTYFIADQALHCTVILLSWLAFYFTPSQFSDNLQNLLQNNQVWLLLIGYYLVIWPLGIGIGKATEKWQQAAQMNQAGLDKAGIWIGRCERILVLTFIITGQYTALGFLMAAKSILRFTDKDEMTQKKTEYVLVGTLMSFASAAIVGVIIAACMK